MLALLQNKHVVPTFMVGNVMFVRPMINIGTTSRKSIGQAMLALLQDFGVLGDFLLQRSAILTHDCVSMPDRYEVARRADAELRRTL
jgi:hypothetical protein